MDILDLIKIYDINNDLLYSINKKVIESYYNKDIEINPYNRHIIKYNHFIDRLSKLPRSIQLKLFRIISFMICNEEDKDIEIDFQFKNTYINKNKYWLVKINDIDMNYIKFKYKEEYNIEKLF